MKIGYIHEKAGKAWNSQINFCSIYPIQGKVRASKLFSLDIIFIDLCMGVHKVTVSICDFVTLNTAVASICRLPVC